MTKRLRGFTAVTVLAFCLTCGAQSVPPPSPTIASVDPSAGSPPMQPAHAACLTPAHLLEIKEYHGPFAKFAASVANKPNILTTHMPHFHANDRLCSLTAGEKFHLFVADAANPFSFVESGFDAALAQADNDDPQFGQGANGYFRRYGAALADNASDEFFTTFVYPAIFRQDPRYYRVAHGPAPKRALHAFNHLFLAHSDSGKIMFNYSEWLGAISSQALGNVYHPGNEPGLRPLGRAVAWSAVQDVGWNLMREFWPEFSRRVRLPFVTIEHP